MSADAKNYTFVLRDEGSPTGEVWRAVFDGKMQTPTWYQRGPASAFLQDLIEGTREPEDYDDER